MHVTFSGAAREVTGSCHLLTVGEHTVALDCGMFQGRRIEAREKNARLPFPPEQLSAIVDLQVARLIGRVSERGVQVELTDAARTLLGDMGYDPTYGARPLKRVIQKHLVDRLALGLLQGDFAAGDHVRVDAAEGELRFERTRAQAPAEEPAPAAA